MSLSKSIHTGLKNNFVRIAGLQVLTKGVGFLREIIIARYFGVSQYADAYVVSQNLFNLFSPLISDAAQIAGTPVLSKIYGQSKIHYLHTAGILIFWSSLAAIFFAFFVAIFINPLLNLITPGLTPEVQNIVRNYIWFLFPYAITLAASGAFAASINSQEKFGLSEFGNLIINAVSVMTLTIIYKVSPTVALPLSLSIGFMCGTMYYLRIIRPNFTSNFLNETALSMVRVLPPVLIGYGLIQANTIVDRYFTSTLSVGSFAAINYANKIIFLPLSIISASINTIAFVKFSKINENQRDRSIVIKVISAVILSLLPFTFIFAVFPDNIVGLFFGGGAFDEKAVELTSLALRVLSFALIPMGLASTLQKKLYADKKPGDVLKGTVLAVVLGIVTNIIAVPKLGLQGVMLAICVSNWGLVIYLYPKVFNVENYVEPQ